MHKPIFFVFLLSFCAFSGATAQSKVIQGLKHFRLNVGLNAGASRLYHDTNFEDNESLRALYNIVAKSHVEREYTWDDFSRDFEMNSSFIQPRFGFSGHLTFKKLPIVFIGEIMSSTSSYENMTFAGTLALGHCFPLGDNIGLGWSVYGGYKKIQDNGWGTKTMINSFGDNYVRDNLNEFFNPSEPLGTARGELFVFRTGLIKTLGELENISVGVEAYGELDVTDRVKRHSRMTNVGAHLFMRFNLFGNWTGYDTNFYPSPNGK